MQGNNLNNQDPVLPNSTIGTGNTPPLATSPTVSATFPNSQLDLNHNIQQPISDETPAPFTSPSQDNTTPTPPVNQTSNISDTQVVGSVLSPASATDKPTGISDDTVITASPHVPKKYGGGKVIATIFGIMLIAGAVVAGVKLVQQRQLLEQEASSGSECQHADDCVLLDNAGNSGSFDAPGTIRYVDITDQDETRFNPGQVDDGCYRVNISGNHVSWEKYGPGPTCKDVSNVQIWHEDDDDTPTSTPTLTPTPQSSSTPTPTKPPGVTSTPTPIATTTVTSTLTPTLPPQVSAQCSAVTAYDTNWNVLNAQTLSQLDPGKTIYLTVSGTSTSGSFDRARFTVNGVLRPETTNTKPGASNIFYDSYTIPAGATTFTVSAQVHHTSLGWF